MMIYGGISWTKARRLLRSVASDWHLDGYPSMSPAISLIGLGTGWILLHGDDDELSRRQCPHGKEPPGEC